MASSLQRPQVRTCIRKETFDYTFDESQIDNIWERIEAVFGKFAHWVPFQLKQLDSDRFVVRYSLGLGKITLIKKASFREQDEETLHDLMESQHA